MSVAHKSSNCRTPRQAAEASTWLKTDDHLMSAGVRLGGPRGAPSLSSVGDLSLSSVGGLSRAVGRISSVLFPEQLFSSIRRQRKCSLHHLFLRALPLAYAKET